MNRLRYTKRLILDHKVFFIFIVFIAILSIVIHILKILNPSLGEILILSKSNPLGIITSIFSHKNFTHLFSNLIFLFLWSFYIIFLNGFLKISEKKKRSRVLVFATFLATVISNIIWLFLIKNPNSTSEGSSGLVFAVVGMAFGFSLINIMRLLRTKLDLYHLLLNFGFFVLVAFMIYFYPSYFFAKGAGVNLLSHLLGFLIGFLISVSYEFIVDKWRPLIKAIDVLGKLATLVGVIIAIFFISTVYIKPTTEIGFCPKVYSGGSCSYDTIYLCSDTKIINVECENFGAFRIESEMFNKGLGLAIDTSLEISIKDIVTPTFESNLTKGFVSYSVDNNKINEQRVTVMNSNIYWRDDSHVLKPNDFRVFSIVFPDDFIISKRPSSVEFVLKENGEIKDSKVVNIKYKIAGRERCIPLTPYPISGIVKSNGNPINSTTVTVRNVNTNQELSMITNERGEYVIELSNFCWYDGDRIEINACNDIICKVVGHRVLNVKEGVIDFNIDLR